MEKTIKDIEKQLAYIELVDYLSDKGLVSATDGFLAVRELNEINKE